MIKYVLIGLILSGVFAAESRLYAVTDQSVPIPEMGLALILAYAARGQGRMLAPLCFLCGWLRGAMAGGPVGFYILAFLFVALLLHHTRSYFFIERALTQFLLFLVCALFYWLLAAVFRGLDLLPDLTRDGLIRLAVSCGLAAILAPLFFALYDRLGRVRKWLHP